MKSDLYYEMKGFNDPVFFAKYVLSKRKGEKASVFDWQAEVLRDFYEGGYRDLTLCLGRRGGKTIFSSILTTFEIFRLLLIHKLEEHYGLPPGSKVYIMNVATSEEQALRTVFGQIEARIENSWWFQKQNYVKRYNEFVFPDIKTHVLSTHSNSSSLVGALCKCVIVDEVARFKQTPGPGSAERVYNAVSQSVRDFGDEGHVVALSSPLLDEDFFYSELVLKGKELNSTLVVEKPTWKCNPNITYESLEAERKRNPETFWRDFGAQPSRALEPYFRDWEKVLNAINKNRHHPLIEDDKFKRDFKPKKNTKYIIAGDPAYKNDAFGLSMVHKENKQVVVDLIHCLEPKSGQEIDPSQVESIISKLIHSFPVEMVVFDIWQYPEVIQRIKDRGIEVAQNFVTKEEYDTLKELFYEKPPKIDLYEHPKLMDELQNLQLVKANKVDHPRHSSKDISDALANACYFAYHQVPYKKPSWLVVE